MDRATLSDVSEKEHVSYTRLNRVNSNIYFYNSFYII